RKSLEKLTDKQVSLNIAEVKTPDLNAQLVAENICFQLERRSSYRRAMKQAITRIMRLGALGVKVRCSGRLMG
ncbi:MAG TPA: 30S ribosomal protein S3, partial [Firmicutes bacterium]|nr:30S ribosomal protein S3 [Bacillota bacterium]